MAGYVPRQIEDPELDKLKEVLRMVIDAIIEYGREDQDYKEWIYEAAFTAFYGDDDFWKWYNELLGAVD